MMTIEEKAKRYDEILARATGAYLPYYTEDIMTKVREFVDYLLPELKKGEDVMIKEKIIATIHLYYGEPLEDEAKEMIAWLEKQGKNISLPKFTFDDVLALQCCMETVKKVQEDKELYKQLQSLHDRLHDAYWLEKQGEQKPTISDEALREGIIKFGITQYQIDNWLKKHINVVEQKPWSEDDEKFFKTALWHISYSISNGKSTDIHCDTTNWLKSLKDRVGCEANCTATWKPSKEHMEALLWCVAHLGGADHRVLGELYEHLKKLREE